MTNARRNLALIVAAAIAVTVGLLTFGPASAADPVTIKLTPWAEGANSVVDVAITNNTSDNLQLDIKGQLPAGAKYFGANPIRGTEFVGGYVHWVTTIAPGRTLVGYQYKFTGTGTATVSVSFIGGRNNGVATASTAAAAAASSGLVQTAVVAIKPPVADLRIVPVPANAANANAIKATLPGTTSTVAMGTTGLPNVSIGVPVTLNASSVDEASPAKTFAWTFTKPTASKAALDKTDAATVKFTPDVVGTYKVDVVVGNEAGKSPMASVQIRAGTYIGFTAGNCKACHAAVSAEWAETPHAEIMKEEIDGGADPATSHYGEGCLRCHTTGYYIGALNGGFADVQAKTGWKFPALASIQRGKGNWDAVPAQLKNVANIQCESCHGPAAQHVNSGAPMAKSVDEGVCNICHNGGGHHIKGTQTAFAKHTEEKAEAWNYPTGPSRQDCVRCHSSEGFISFLKNPTEKATWSNDPAPLGCVGCHDPHSEANKMQLRVTGKPVEAVGLTKDFALSAVCAECHNARNTGASAASGSTPHYSAAAEMMAGTGGVTYGQTIVNSPHGSIVGAGPMKDASGADLFAGNTPGPCVACHMYPTPADAKDPLQNKVGEHSWNLKSPDGTVDYTAPCQSCHPGVKDFNFGARADYDGNGKIETVEAEVAALLKTLQTAIANSGIKPMSGHPYFDQTNKANWTLQQKNAIYNYLFVRGLEGTDGRANAIHNFKRSVRLVQLSYKDLTGKDVPTATLLK